MKKSLRPCNRTWVKSSFINHLLQHTPKLFCYVHMRSCNGGTPAIATPSNLLINPLFHQLQLGSDIQECLTRTGLTPSPARCNFRVFPTVFVIVFHSFYKFHSVNYTEKSRFRQGLDKDICCFPRQIFLFFFFCLPHYLFYAILSTHK